jgi:hypothetical protein
MRAICAVVLEHFQEKWNPVFRPKMRQRNNAGAVSVAGLCRTALAAAALLAHAAAIAQPGPPDPAKSSAPSIQNFGETEKTCTAWTDDCRSCRREADNTVNCSNIGIACQPAEIKCTARQQSVK